MCVSGEKEKGKARHAPTGRWRQGEWRHKGQWELYNGRLVLFLYLQFNVLLAFSFDWISHTIKPKLYSMQLFELAEEVDSLF